MQRLDKAIFLISLVWHERTLKDKGNRKVTMTIDRFADLEDEVRGIICQALDAMKVKSPSDFVLLLARADFHEWLDRDNLDLTPYVIEDERGTMMDITRQTFLVKYVNSYIDKLMSNQEESDEEREYELNIQMMMYSHIWESVLFLKQLERIALVLNGKGYLWERKFDDKLKKGQYIKDCIIDRFKKVDKDMYNLLVSCYSKKLRNDFAHSTYHIQMETETIYSHQNGLFAGNPIKICDWEEMFLKSVMLSYHLNDILIKVKDAFIETFGKEPIGIRLPKKGQKGKFLNAYIYPEYDSADSVRVRFAFLKKGQN